MASLYDAFTGELQSTGEYQAANPFVQGGQSLLNIRVQPETSSQAVWQPILTALVGGALKGYGQKQARQQAFEETKSNPLVSAFTSSLVQPEDGAGIGPLASGDDYGGNLAKMAASPLDEIYLQDKAPKGWTAEVGKRDLLKSLIAEQEKKSLEEEARKSQAAIDQSRRSVEAQMLGQGLTPDGASWKTDPNIMQALGETERVKAAGRMAAETTRADPLGMNSIPAPLQSEAVKEFAVEANTEKQILFGRAQYEKAGAVIGSMSGAAPFGLTEASATINAATEALRQAYQNAVGREMSGPALDSFNAGMAPTWRDTPEILAVKATAYEQLIRDGTGKATPILDSLQLSKKFKNSASTVDAGAAASPLDAGASASPLAASASPSSPIMTALAANAAAPEEQGFGRRMGNAVYSTFDNMTLGAGDEITAGGNALIDALQGAPLGAAYDERLGQARQFNSEVPLGTKLVTSIPAALAMPLSSAKTVAQVLKQGAALGGISGFLAGEGDLKNRAINSAKGAALGGAAGGAIGGIGKSLNALKTAAPKLADATEAGLMGVTRGDITRSTKNAGLTVDEFGEIVGPKLLETTKRLAKAGFLKGNSSAHELVNRAGKKVDDLGNQITPIIEKADQLLTKKIKVDWTVTKAYLKTLSGEPREMAEIAFKEGARALKKDLAPGTVAAFQKAKRGLWTEAFDPADKVKSEIAKRMGTDLKLKVETVTNSVLGKGSVRTVKSINAEMGDYLAVLPHLELKLARESAATVPEKIVNFIKTTGGFGSGLLASAYTGNPIYALGGATTALATTNTGSRAMIAALRGGSQAIRSAKGGTAAFRPQSLISEALGREKKKVAMENSDPKPAVAPAPAPKPAAAAAQPTPNAALPRKLVAAVIHQESRGNANAISPKGALGIMQIMPDTAKDIARELGVKEYDMKNAETNQRFGEHYLSQQLKRFGTPELALAAYNAGPAKVQQWITKYGADWNTIKDGIKADIDAGKLKSRYYHETLDYVPKIMARYLAV